MLYIISQVLVAIGIVFDFIGRTTKTKKSIISFMVIASIFYVLSYFFLLRPLPAIFNALCIVRGVVFLYLDEKQKSLTPYIITSIILLTLTCVSVAVYWNNVLDVFMIVSMLLLLFIFTFKNTLIIRLGLIGNFVLWMTYNFSLSAYVNMASDTLQVIPTIASLIWYDLIEPRKQDDFTKTTNKILEIIKSPI